MLQKFFNSPVSIPVRRFFWKCWYNIFASVYGDINISLMNYGYAAADGNTTDLVLDPSREAERFCIQMYDHVARAVPLAGKDVLEVGCGRGGGAAYVAGAVQPRSLAGVDFSHSNIELCRRMHCRPELNFVVGDAESLQFDDESFDAVINIESSHCYPHPDRFFAEAFRILRPQGFFLYADFREKAVVPLLHRQLQAAGFDFLRQETITPNVLRSMDLEHERKTALIRERIPWVMQGLSKWFVAARGTSIYNDFQKGALEYFFYVLHKAAR